MVACLPALYIEKRSGHWDGYSKLSVLVLFILGVTYYTSEARVS